MTTLYPLRTVIQVEEDAVWIGLRAELDRHLHGPEFSCGDEVTFVALAEGDPGFDRWFPAPLMAALVPGGQGVIGCYHADADEPEYSVLVRDVAGDIARVGLPAARLQKREADHAAA